MNEEYIPKAGQFDILAGTDHQPCALPLLPEIKQGGTTPASKAPAAKPVLEVLSLKDILGFEPPVGAMLVGDGIIELGENALLFGPPGGYKSFAVGHLMLCGARGFGEWLGHKVNGKFASLWLNCENGRRRLRDQFMKMDLPTDAGEYIHVTDIPSVWDLSDPKLIAEIRRVIQEKKIWLLIIDTVSNFVEDEFAKQFAAFFRGHQHPVAWLGSATGGFVAAPFAQTQRIGQGCPGTFEPDQSPPDTATTCPEHLLPGRGNRGV